MYLLFQPEEEDSIYRPPEVLESFDISHRRAIDEEDLEPEEGYFNDKSSINVNLHIYIYIYMNL